MMIEIIDEIWFFDKTIEYIGLYNDELYLVTAILYGKFNIYDTYLAIKISPSIKNDIDKLSKNNQPINYSEIAKKSDRIMYVFDPYNPYNGYILTDNVDFMELMNHDIF